MVFRITGDAIARVNVPGVNAQTFVQASYDPLSGPGVRFHVVNRIGVSLGSIVLDPAGMRQLAEGLRTMADHVDGLRTETPEERKARLEREFDELVG